jgi:hypothetical protein
MNNFSISNKKIIYDLGANDGIDTQYYLKKNYKVLAIEPDKNLNLHIKKKRKTKKIEGDKKENFYNAMRNFIITPRAQDIRKKLKGFKKLVFLLKKITYILLFQKKYHMIPQLVDLYYVKYFDKKSFSNLYKKKYIEEYYKIINFVSKNNILKTYL